MCGSIVTKHEYGGDHQMRLFDASLLRHADVLGLPSIALELMWIFQSFISRMLTEVCPFCSLGIC